MTRANPAKESSRSRDRAVSTIALLSVLTILVAAGIAVAAVAGGGLIGGGDEPSPATATSESGSGTPDGTDATDGMATETPGPEDIQVRAWEDWFRELLATGQEQGTTNVEIREYELNQSSNTVIVTHTTEPGASHDLVLAASTMRTIYQHMINWTIHHEQPTWQADFRGRIVNSEGDLVATHRIENEWIRAYLRGEMTEDELRTRHIGTLEMVDENEETPE